eukprot:scaffold18505_cov108-Skeletonema_menzelii.AAC.1
MEDVLLEGKLDPPKHAKSSAFLQSKVAFHLQVQVVWAEYISFYAIVTNYNGPLATPQARIDIATHMKVAKLEAILALK